MQLIYLKSLIEQIVEAGISEDDDLVIICKEGQPAVVVVQNRLNLTATIWQQDDNLKKLKKVSTL